jgi:hypothetical protein
MDTDSVSVAALLNLFKAKPETHASMILKKAGFTSSAILPGMGEAEFIGEPYLWLHSFVVRRPKRSDFVDDLDCPGRYVVGFTHAVATLYGPLAAPQEMQQLRRIYESMSREYFSYLSLGGTDMEVRRLLRNVEHSVDEARALLDWWDAMAVATSIGKQQGDDFLKVMQASRLHVSRRAQVLLNSVMRVRSAPAAVAERVLPQGAPKVLLQRTPKDGESATANLPPPELAERKGSHSIEMQSPCARSVKAERRAERSASKTDAASPQAKKPTEKRGGQGTGPAYRGKAKKK